MHKVQEDLTSRQNLQVKGRQRQHTKKERQSQGSNNREGRRGRGRHCHPLGQDTEIRRRHPQAPALTDQQQRKEVQDPGYAGYRLHQDHHKYNSSQEKRDPLPVRRPDNPSYGQRPEDARGRRRGDNGRGQRHYRKYQRPEPGFLKICLSCQLARCLLEVTKH